ncbi:hypothetical protein [Methanolobus sp. ZRKC5]|uniref:hypothetical protein n=1 Tax=Methanolobus sp. ZRKC5 TaxID=3136295 RepID=UPI00313E9B29
MEIKYFSDFSFSDIITSIGLVILLFCIQSVIKNRLLLMYFAQKYIKPKPYLILLFAFEISLGFMVFNSMKNYFVFALLGGILWVTSGFFRLIVQATKAIFDEESAKLAGLLQNYSYLRTSYFTLLFIWLVSKLQFIPSMKSIFSSIESPDQYLDFSIYFATWVISIIIYGYFMLNLYPYFVKDKDVIKSIDIIQFISRKEKGRSFKEIVDNFKDESEVNIQEKLNHLIYSGFIEKDRKYKLAPLQKHAKKT